jgi:chromosome segregation ATPase
MARGGVNKAVVQTARLALIARGEHPSIDAVRIEMGNTGSKTTIHRYLRELDESDNRSGPPGADIGEELTELVARLAQRLDGQAQERVEHAQTAFDERCAALQEALTQTEKNLAEREAHLAQESEQLRIQTAALIATREQLQSEQTHNARLLQANQDLETRVQDKDGQIRSLEEKHLHARDALEHYRNAIKEQREQEQRRHEAQVQQLQMELRQAQHSAMGRQEEITQLNRDNERLLGESRNSQRELHNQEARLSTLSTQANSTAEKLQHAEARSAVLEERLRTAQEESSGLKQRTTETEQQNRVLELILIKTELALENLRAAQAEAATAPAPDGAEPEVTG